MVVPARRLLMAAPDEEAGSTVHTILRVGNPRSITHSAAMIAVFILHRRDCTIVCVTNNGE